MERGLVVATDVQTTDVAPVSHAGALLEARVRLWLADRDAAVQRVREATERMIEQNERRAPGAPLDGNTFMPAICALLDSFLELADVAGSIVQGVPATVDEEVQARLSEAMQEAFLLQAALAADRPQA